MADDKCLTVSNLPSNMRQYVGRLQVITADKWGKEQGINKYQKLPHRETDILCLNPALQSDKERSLPLDCHLVKEWTFF